VHLVVAVVAVFGLAAITPALTRVLGRDVGYLGAAVFLGLAGWLASDAPAVLGGTPVTAEVAWLPSAGLSFALRLDSLGLLFALIVLGIGALVLAYGARYFARDQRAKASRYLSLLTFFAGAMLGLVLADDAVLLFVFWELTSVSSFFLIGGLGEGKAGAIRAFLVTAIGGLALLAGVVLLSVVTGTTSLSAILADAAAITSSPLAPAIIVLLLLAAATKSAQLPFHFWLPGAMVAPTPVSTYLHAATMVKAGIYLLFRFSPVFGGDVRWQVPLVLLGLATAVFGAVVASNRNDLKSLLAYSTVSQLGLLVGIIGIGTPLALAAAALHTLAHALYKAALFMTVGIVDHETGTRDLRQLGGLRRTLPLTAFAGGVAALSMAGLPPLLGFVSKEEALASFVELGEPAWLGPLAVVLAVTASIGTFVYSARYYLRTFEGPVRTAAHPAPTGFAAPAALAAATGLVLGLVVPFLDPLVNAISRDTTGTSAELHLALWHGLTVPLLLSAIVIGSGLVLVWRRDAVERLQDRVTMWSGEGVFDRSFDASVALGRLVGRQATPNAPAAYLLPIVALVLAGGVTMAVLTDLPSGPAAGSLPADWAIIVLLAGCIVGVVQARSRLAAVATLGLAGFTVAGWFVLLGAPDLALTQLLVETLTVALVVVVFRRLPSTFARGGARRKVSAGLIAATVGILAGTATFLLTGRRELSDIGARFLAEGEGLTGGSNVVNTILVDFRALDTLGEITVIAAAAAAIVAIVRQSERDPIPRPGLAPQPPSDDIERWGGIGVIDSPILRSANTLLAPVMVAVSLWLLVRGHGAVGGGFIGGLTAGAAVVLLYFSRGHQRIWQSRLLRTLPLAGTGLLIAVGYGLGGLAFSGSFLDGGKLAVPGVGLELAASLVFDVGVYLVVVGMVVGIVRHLGQGIPEEPPDPERIRVSPLDPDAAAPPPGAATSASGRAAQAPGRGGVR
jgi:multicomponent Na+:H+ antiporter subunit A